MMSKYRMKYEQWDFGTERLLTVYDADTGQTIGARDPFWPCGIPLSDKRRKARMQVVATEILLAAGRIAATGL